MTSPSFTDSSFIDDLRSSFNPFNLPGYLPANRPENWPAIGADFPSASGNFSSISVEETIFFYRKWVEDWWFKPFLCGSGEDISILFFFDRGKYFASFHWQTKRKRKSVRENHVTLKGSKENKLWKKGKKTWNSERKKEKGKTVQGMIKER